MAYIEVRTTLPEHVKTRVAARRLGVSRYELMGHLVTLWIWALDNVPSDGFLDEIDDVDLADAAGWPGKKSEKFVEVLVAAGFIDDHETGRYLHDWEDYAGKLLKKREADRDRKRQARNGQRVQRTARGRRADGAGMSSGSREDVRDLSQPSRAAAGGRTVTVPTPTVILDGGVSTAREATATNDAAPAPPDEATDSVELYHGLTGSIPRDNGLAWINRLDAEHGPATVQSALRVEAARDRNPKTILGRVETRLGDRSLGNAPKPNRVNDYDSLARAPLKGSRAASHG